VTRAGFILGALAAALALSGLGCNVHTLQAVILPAPTCEEPAPTPLLDQITFGDANSEAAHAFAGPDTILGTGAFELPTRRIAVGAPLVFQLASAPDAQNYLTIKLWGSDTDAAVLFLYVNGTQVGAYEQDLPELDLNVGDAAYPGRFIYVTYPLPLTATTGNISVPLTINAVASVSSFAPPGREEQPLTQPTRPIYAAYVHTDPFFVPPSTDMQGTPPVVTPRAAPAGYPDFAGAHQDTDTAVTALLGWQLYGDAWNSAVAAGQVPAAVLGLFAKGTTTSRFSTTADWENWAVSTTTAGNSTVVNALTVLSLIYQSSWSQYYQSADILARVTRALDSLALMQGSNGAFTNATWVGAPTRAAATGSATEGSGTKALGWAVVTLADALAMAGLLDVMVDDDDDPTTPPIPRRQAWANMLVAHRDFLSSTAGRSQETMYDQSQVEALWLADAAVGILDPSRTLLSATALGYVDSTVGLADGPIGGLSVSPKGLPLMPNGTLNGSYDGRFGFLTIRSMCALGRLTADPGVLGQCINAIHAAAAFLYPAADDGASTIRAEGAITAEINRNPGFLEYGGNAYAADVLGDPVALRSIQLQLANYEPLSSSVIAQDVLFAENLAGYLEDLPSVERVATLPDGSYRFPMEDGQPDFVWTDEQGASGAIRNCGDRLYIALNWRHGFDGAANAADASVDNIARIHLSNNAYDRVATIAMESPSGFGRFYTATFGPYLIGMNLSTDSSYQLPPFTPPADAFELVQRRPAAAATTVVVPPGETRVLYRQTR
jgi:hypothetical protein